jgi:hypothetical protein
MSSAMLTRKLIFAVVCAAGMLSLPPLQAQQATEIQMTYSGGQFQPGQISAPADKPLVFRVWDRSAQSIRGHTCRTNRPDT